MLHIRPATDADAPAIARVHVASWRSTYAGLVPDAHLAALDEAERAESWRMWLTFNIQVFIAEHDSEIIGFISGGPIREPLLDCDAELYAIYLLQTAQRHGAGTALLQTLAAALLIKGFRSVAVWVLEANHATHFYIHSGAKFAASKSIEIGGASLIEQAYIWPDLHTLVPPAAPAGNRK